MAAGVSGLTNSHKSPIIINILRIVRCIVISIFYNVIYRQIFLTLFFLHKMSDMLDIDYIGYRIPNIIDIEEI